MEPKKKVLVVDDELDIAFILKKMLEGEGYEVICVNNGPAAVEVAKCEKLFAITLDMMMEDTTGWQVIHSLKGDNLTKDIPIIIISSLRNQVKNLGIKLGAIEYIVKPFTRDQVITALKRIEKKTNS